MAAALKEAGLQIHGIGSRRDDRHVHHLIMSSDLNTAAAVHQRLGRLGGNTCMERI